MSDSPFPLGASRRVKAALSCQTSFGGPLASFGTASGGLGAGGFRASTTKSPTPTASTSRPSIQVGKPRSPPVLEWTRHHGSRSRNGNRKWEKRYPRSSTKIKKPDTIQLSQGAAKGLVTR